MMNAVKPVLQVSNLERLFVRQVGGKVTKRIVTQRAYFLPNWYSFCL